MKNTLNLILGIQSGHFTNCPHIRMPESVDTDTNCHCEKKVYRMTLNIGLTMFALELLGGLVTNSLSLIGDSLHLLADSSAVIVGLIVIALVSKNKDKENFYRRNAVIINGSSLFLVSAYLLYHSFGRLLNPSGTAGLYMTIIAVIGIIGNFLQHHILISVKGNSQVKDLMRSSIVLHIFSDLLQSFAVVAGGIAIIYTSSPRVGYIIDPFLSTGIGFIMTIYAIKLIFQAFQGEDDHHDHCGHDHGHHHHH